MIRTAIGLAALLFAFGALAQDSASGLGGILPPGEGRSVCFVRNYDAAHLKRNPRQMTRSIRVMVSEGMAVAGGDFRGYTIRIETVRRKEPAPLFAIGACEFSDDINRTVTNEPIIRTFKRNRGVHCMMLAGPDTEGGYVIADRAGPTLWLHTIEDVIHMRPAQSSSKSSPGKDVSFEAPDNVFRLSEASASACADMPAKSPDFRN